ncbi:MAG: TlpA family protein disulfide reductase [Chloracidobacterium sp.]|nr:TlpA family protein disulfide reductase [Chloracidobacterium sp.]
MKIIRIFVLSIFALSFSVAVSAQVGRKAENFTAVTMDGKTVELASLKGKVVLLVFWSSRCSICQAEIPQLNEIAAGYRKKNIVFLAATMESESIAENFLRRNRFDFQILPDSFGLLLKYADRDREGRVNIGFPAYYLIDRSGYIQFKDSGWDKTKPLADAIDKTLSNR